MNNRPHLIEGISFAEMWVLCTCGAVIEAQSSPILEVLWDRHRGVSADEAAKRDFERSAPGEMATDDEIEAFLSLVRNPHYEYEGD